MARIKYEAVELKFMSLFEQITKAKLKDCIITDSVVVFVVQQGEIGRAVGKKGANVKLLEKALKRKIKIVEYSPELITFINNLIYPLKTKDIKDEEGIITIIPPDTETRGLLIGRNASKLRFFEIIAKRYFDIKEIKVI